MLLLFSSLSKMGIAALRGAERTPRIFRPRAPPPTPKKKQKPTSKKKNPSHSLLLLSLSLYHTHKKNILSADLKRYIVSQTNVRSLELSSDASRWCSAAAVPDWAVLGKKLGKGVSAVRAALADADAELLSKIERGEESVVVAGFELAPGEVKVVRKFAPSAEAIASMPPGAAVDGAGGDAGTGDALFVALDLSLDEDLLAEGTAREVASRVQKARKSAGLSAQDPAVAWLGGVEEEEKEEKAAAAPLPAPLAAALERQAVLLKAAIGGEWRELRDLPSGTEELIREEHSLPAGRFELVLTRGQ